MGRSSSRHRSLRPNVREHIRATISGKIQEIDSELQEKIRK